MPVLTLTSDIGTEDYIVGAIKGVLLSINSSFNLIDITHKLSPFNFPQTAYICRNAIQHYPAHSFHLILINSYHTKPEKLLLVQHKEQYIICADNGLITMILEEKPEKVIGLALPKSEEKNILRFAQLAGEAFLEIANGKSMDELGEITEDYIWNNHLRPTLGTNHIEGQILFIDNFENVIVNIRKEEFEDQRRGRKFAIVFKRDEKIDKLSESYADVQHGEKLALFNASGYLEIAINKGNAAGLFGLQGYNESQKNNSNLMIYQTVKIHFID